MQEQIKEEPIKLFMKVWYASKTLKKFLNPNFYEKEVEALDLVYYCEDENLKEELYFLSKEQLEMLESVKDLFYVVTLSTLDWEFCIHKTYTLFNVKKKGVEINKRLKMETKTNKNILLVSQPA